MDELIKTICQALIEEAEAVKNYTEGIRLARDSDSQKVFALNRLDAVEHIQNLTLELTRQVSPATEDSTGGGPIE